jgi:uncharacterized damage-inducible protein DinB
MEMQIKRIVWSQFDAALETLKRAIDACPDEVWSDDKKPAWKERDVVGYWYLAFHTIFWLDFYMSDPAELGDDPEASFKAHPPFDEREFSYDGLLPERAYTRLELLTYLDYTWSKAKARLQAIDHTSPSVRKNLGAIELMLYNMRHIQHHAAQMNLVLRQKTGGAPGWVGKGKRAWGEGV